MTLKKTPWYPGAIQPARAGYYEVDSGTLHRRNRYFLTGRRRLWDGTSWRGGWMNEIVSVMGKHPEHKWRGLTAESYLAAHVTLDKST